MRFQGENSMGMLLEQMSPSEDPAGSNPGVVPVGRHGGDACVSPAHPGGSETSLGSCTLKR